jgi:hypothetical protein
VPQLTASSVVRDILTVDPTLSADDVIKRAKARGLKTAEGVLRATVHNVRSELKKKAARAATAAATPPATAPAAPAATPVPASPIPADLTSVLANVARVNAVVEACGGVEPVRQAAEAVRACGGVDGFLVHLDLVAGIRTPGPTS